MKKIDWKKIEKDEYKKLVYCSRRVGAEGCVLIKNENNLLPLTREKTISVFGRMQNDYYMSGLGSGGLVNVRYCVSIIDGIKNNENLLINEELAEIYKKWSLENPTTIDYQWKPGVWSKPEMLISDEFVKKAREKSDVAVIVLGRMAGETRDNAAVKGCWYLSDEEELLLEVVAKHFKETVVILNTSNIIGMEWVEKYNIKSVLYVWLGGQEGGNSVADVLSGEVCPSGKLTDTIAKDINLYPSTKNFGDERKNIYQEDIYVGYRYFETFKKDAVRYPFGYGLSYTDFEIDTELIGETDEKIELKIKVKNIGDISGKEIVQIYFSAPQGRLGKSAIELCDFRKTHLLHSGEEQSFCVEVEKCNLSAYDDSGVSGYKSCYILEAGDYSIYVGRNVREIVKVCSFYIDKTVVTKKLTEVLSPVEQFKVLIPEKKGDKYCEEYRTVHMRETDYDKKIKGELPEEIEQTGNKGIKLVDVKEKRNTIKEFVAQLSDDELMCLIKGEGMCSPKARPGAAGIFGGTSQELNLYGIPIAVACDGPSGLRFDNGDFATSIPCGTAIASTWNENIAEEIYSLLSIELCLNHVDTILGPGINIHRSPLCGRNFEYFSEDPLLTGKIAAAQVRGIAEYNNTATIKHFAANSQELKRSTNNSVLSERALREIYLKGFEIAVKEGGVKSIMTSYNLINGRWSFDSYELNTVVLRQEWGYDGIVMTDWWSAREKSKLNADGYLRQMVEAQNDVYMVTEDAKNHKDDLPSALAEGKITRGQLQRNAINILNFLINTNSFERFIELGGKLEKSLSEDLDILKVVEVVENPMINEEIIFEFKGKGKYLLVIEYKSPESELVQKSFNICVNGLSAGTKTIGGTNAKSKIMYFDISVAHDVELSKKPNTMKFVCDDIQIAKVTVMMPENRR